MHALHNLARCEDTRQTLAADADVASTCAHVLQSASARGATKEQAAATLACLCEMGHRVGIVAAGGAEGLVALLQAGSEAGQLQAVRAICSLAEHAGSHAALRAGLPTLVQLAGGGGEAQKWASNTLHKLSSGCDAEAMAALANSVAAMALLVEQLSGSAEDQRSAVSSLRHLCGRPEAQQAIVSGGGVAALVAIAQSHGDSQARSQSALVLASLSGPPYTQKVAESGAVEVLVDATKSGGAEVTLAAAAALEQLVGVPAAQSAILAGRAAPVVELLHSPSQAVQLHALRVMGRIATDAEQAPPRFNSAARTPRSPFLLLPLWHSDLLC